MEGDPAGTEEPDDRADSAGWRAALPLLGLTVVLVVTGWFVDHRFRASEEAHVRSCVGAADLAVDSAYGPVVTMVGSVRRQLDEPRSDKQLRSAYGLVARSAEGGSERLEGVRATCEDVGVLPWHGGVAVERDACVARIDEHQEVLAALADDGSRIEAGLPDLAAAC